MATTTTIMSLTKPATTDPALIGDINSNMDIIDSWFVAAAATNQAIGDAAAAGSTAQVARVDHKHGLPNFGSPVSTASANANGAATTIARADHVHTNGTNSIGSASVFAAGSIPTARAYHDANQSIADATTVALVFNSERWDTDTIHSTAVNTGRLTCVTGGKYLIVAQVAWDEGTNATGYRVVGIRYNGLQTIAVDSRTSAGNTIGITYQQISTQFALSATDYVEVIVQHNGGAAKNILASGATQYARSEFYMTWLTP